MRALTVPLHPKPGSKQLIELRPLRSHCHAMLRRRGREGTSLNVRDGRRGSSSLLPPQARQVGRYPIWRETEGDKEDERR